MTNEGWACAGTCAGADAGAGAGASANTPVTGVCTISSAESAPLYPSSSLVDTSNRQREMEYSPSPFGSHARDILAGSPYSTSSASSTVKTVRRSSSFDLRLY